MEMTVSDLGFEERDKGLALQVKNCREMLCLDEKLRADDELNRKEEENLAS